MPIFLPRIVGGTGLNPIRPAFTAPSGGGTPPPPLGFGDGALVWQDTFAYADVSSIDGVGGWWAPGITGEASLGVATGALQRVAGGSWAGAKTSKTDFSRGVDVAFEVAGVPDSSNAIIASYLGTGNDTATTGYAVHVVMNPSNPTRLRLQRWVNDSAQATHVDVSDKALAVGDAVGMRIAATTVELWRRVSGVWEQVGSTATDTNLTSGTLSIETNSASTRIDGVKVTVIP